jgi:hypothetical protein
MWELLHQRHSLTECPEFSPERRILRQARLQALALAFTQLPIQVCREQLVAPLFLALASSQ